MKSVKNRVTYQKTDPLLCKGIIVVSKQVRVQVYGLVENHVWHLVESPVEDRVWNHMWDLVEAMRK